VLYPDQDDQVKGSLELKPTDRQKPTDFQGSTVLLFSDYLLKDDPALSCRVVLLFFILAIFVNWVLFIQERPFVPHRFDARRDTDDIQSRTSYREFASIIFRSQR
jgi:hypothetical protein